MPVVLPTELLRPIFGHVTNNKDLCSLALTCHTLREEAQRAMFQHVVVTIYTSKKQASTPFLNAIIASPNRLALMVRKINIKVYHIWEEQKQEHYIKTGEIYTGWLSEIGPKMAKALQLMTRITHLRVQYQDWDPVDNKITPWLESLLEGCAFRLKVLVWDVLTLDVENFISKSLANQTDICALVVSSESQDFSDPQLQKLLGKLCKGLHTLSGSWEMIRSVLESGQTIQHLKLTSIPDSPRPSTTVLRKALRGVTNLWSNAPFARLDFGIADLSNVVILQIGCLFEEDYAAIVTLKKLTLLILTNNLNSPDNQAQMVKYLLSYSESLTEIYIEDWTMYSQPYSCYTYNAVEHKVQCRGVPYWEMNTLRRPDALQFLDAIDRTP
ncbi:hypothetical protein D9619_011244 [Psilocybe cf. subviscida]|uniref:F-box domain-containing protein n=1 Tax=Psilocybe cf. subviscida TaxID=2480587 RepID=A0A8H5F5K4_9AGAR|nr:hypothetical protein D9619_011244 [Psilocybe cf. subviscida]